MLSVVFIAEITARAFIIADSNKRRTLSRADIAKALSKSDQFDFLIDIVPREEPPGAAGQAGGKGQKKGAAAQGNGVPVSRSVFRWRSVVMLSVPQAPPSRENSQQASIENEEANAEDVTNGVDLEQVRLPIPSS